ncbi:MAG: glutamate mutase L [Anaerolineae bacterium]
MADEGLTIESILVADVGSTTTKVALIDCIEGVFRLVAHAEAATTAVPPKADVSLGVRQALGEIERIANRRLLDQDGQLITPERSNGNGVDAFVATASAAAPLRVMLAGLMWDLSMTSGRHAVNSTYAIVEDTISLDGEGPRWTAKGGRQANLDLLHQRKPEVILLVGGVDQGAVEGVVDAAQVIGMVCSVLDGGHKPEVIYAGNVTARSQVAQIVADKANLRVVDNVLPRLHTENTTGVEEELENIYRERKLARLPGLGGLLAWTSHSIEPTAVSFGITVEALARQYALNVLGADIGGATTTLVSSIEGHFGRVVRADLGLSHNMDKVAEVASLEAILRWLPFELTPGEARSRIMNKVLRPTTIPETQEDLLFEQAVAREALRLAMDEARPRWSDLKAVLYEGLSPQVDFIIGSGGVLAHAAHYGQATLILLDALQPIGVTNLMLDKACLAPQLGTLAAVHSLAAAQIATKDGLLGLGTVISPVGRTREGKPVLRFKVQYEGDSPLEGEVLFGSLEVIPLAPGQKATLELRPTHQFDIGLGTKGRGAITEVEGGAVGLIIDGRGRPLHLAEDDEQRRAKIQEWLWDVGA